jgi:hypothetical protein
MSKVSAGGIFERGKYHWVKMSDGSFALWRGQLFIGLHVEQDNGVWWVIRFGHGEQAGPFEKESEAKREAIYQAKEEGL